MQRTKGGKRRRWGEDSIAVLTSVLEIGRGQRVTHCRTIPRMVCSGHWEVLEPKTPIRGVLGVIEMNLNLYLHCAQSLTWSSLGVM